MDQPVRTQLELGPDVVGVPMGASPMRSPHLHPRGVPAACKLVANCEDQRMRMIARVTASAALLSLAMAGAQRTASVTESPRYEVVSIKPGKSDCGMSVYGAPNRFQAQCITVWGLMFNAYNLKPDDHPAGLPGWADSVTFDVDAKMDDSVAAALQKLPMKEQGRQRQLMLQALLADRFKLQTHTETRERDIYALVITKAGSKLKLWPADKTPKGISWGASSIRVQGEPLEKFAFCLSDTLGRDVIDKTGLTGNYDIELKWTPDSRQGQPDAGPTIFTALEEQLGLKLESTKGPADVMVVDHVERPSEN